jgi:hypothetical protein
MVGVTGFPRLAVWRGCGATVTILPINLQNLLVVEPGIDCVNTKAPIPIVTNIK